MLDDSTDETVEFAKREVARRAAAGFPIVHLHREDRAGFKAGALAAGLEASEAARRAPFVAIFDADFIPRPDFLRRTLPPMLADARCAGRAGALGAT